MVRSINSLNMSSSSELERVSQLSQHGKIKAGVTFWGSRVVTIEGYQGSMYLEDFAKKILEAGHLDNVDKLTATGRCAGIDIARKIQQLYRNTDRDLKKTKNCFTRFLCSIRERGFRLFPSTYGTRWHIEENAIAPFTSSTEDAFKKAFHLDEEASWWENDACEAREHGRVQISEHALRQLAREEQLDNLPVTPEMVQSIKLTGSCRESFPCQHSLTITLLNGQEKKANLNGKDLSILIEATRDSVKWSQKDIKHFESYINHSFFEDQPQKTAAEILSGCFFELLEDEIEA